MRSLIIGLIFCFGCISQADKSVYKEAFESCEEPIFKTWAMHDYMVFSPGLTTECVVHDPDCEQCKTNEYAIYKALQDLIEDQKEILYLLKNKKKLGD